MYLEHFPTEKRKHGWIEVICGSMFSGKTEELIRRLKKNGWPTKVVVFTMATNPKWPEAWAEGVQGLVSKTSPKETLMTCIRAVSAGERWIDESIWLADKGTHDGAPKRLENAARLTAREITIIKALMRERSNRR